LPSLNTLELCGNGTLDISGIERYAGLTCLALRNERIPDLTPLTGLPGLRELDLREADADLSPLLECASLQKVICSPDMQSRVDAIKDEAQFVIEIKTLP
jgi:Leucine-rich repeat (LRR) protein